jgi:hypothetical protein
MAIKATHLAGFLIRCDINEPSLRRNLEGSPSVSFLNQRTIWFWHYIYTTINPIPKVDDPLAQPPFRHEILICQVSKGFLLLGIRHHVIGHLLDWEVSQRLQVPWRHARIDIQTIIQQRLDFDPSHGQGTIAPPLSEYDVSYLVAQTESFRGLVRKITFSGDNVMHAPIFRDHVANLECTSCTLKNEGGEVLTIGWDGYVSFYLPKEDPGQAIRLREVMSILKTLHDLELLSF